jgi:hypothetical protein
MKPKLITLTGNYFLFKHQAVVSRSLRMTCKRLLSDHYAGIR